MRSEAAYIDELRGEVYALHPTPASARAALERLANETGCVLRSQILLTDCPLAELLGELGRVGARLLDASCNDAGTVAVIELSRTWGGRYRRTERDRCLLVVGQNSGVLHAVTDAGAAFWSNVLRYAVRHAYPTVSTPAFSNDEMAGMLVRLRERLNVDDENMRVQRLLHKARLLDPGARRELDVELRWTDLPLSHAFEQVAEVNAWIQKLDFAVYRDGERTAEGHLSRDGDLAFDGDWGLFVEASLAHGSALASRRFMQLHDRGRPLDALAEAKPFFIQYEADVFTEPGATRRLVGTLQRMSHASQSVIHDNPYLHVSVLDYLEDASCEVFVLASNRITVVPQPHSTATALSRLYGHICQEFGEGDLVDYAEVYPA